MSFLWAIILLAATVQAGVVKEEQNNEVPRITKVHLTNAASESTSIAVCNLVSSSGYNVNGSIVLSQDKPGDPVDVSGMISGLTPGNHGFHIHQNPDLSDNCKAAGPHFNPEMFTHGAPHDSERHAGDLGNIPANEMGFSAFQLRDTKITLCLDSPFNVLKKSIVVHEREDDLGRGKNEESKKTGNAGARVACCVIEPVLRHFPRN